MITPSTLELVGGCYCGAELPMEGRGKFRRHVMLRPEVEIDAVALKALVAMASADVQARLPMEQRIKGHEQVR
ncbi:MAG: hypothetical protein IV092_01320 [Burkholderiaceae bacterium]|nr:hypothetical protein [Burkholderiaceae bacterium]MBT9499855.1 hypothetical protein [Burkholderiaceae bacterium]